MCILQVRSEKANNGTFSWGGNNFWVTRHVRCDTVVTLECGSACLSGLSVAKGWNDNSCADCSLFCWNDGIHSYMPTADEGEINCFLLNDMTGREGLTLGGSQSAVCFRFIPDDALLIFTENCCMCIRAATICYYHIWVPYIFHMYCDF